MDDLSGLAELTLSPLAEVFLFNRSDRPIRVSVDGLGSSFVLQPRCWKSWQTRRGTSLRIATSDLGRHSFDLWANESWGKSIGRFELKIPLEVGDRLLWGWDGLAWRHLKGEAIHDLDPSPRLFSRPAPSPPVKILHS
jgi:hypothetical protein